MITPTSDDPKTCQCLCGCRNAAMTTDETGAHVCDVCADYTVDDKAKSNLADRRPYLIWSMEPSEMLSVYAAVTWGSRQPLPVAYEDLLYEILCDTWRRSRTLREQKLKVLAWMDRSDAKIARTS